MDVTNAGMLIEGNVTLDGSPFKLVWSENFTKKKNTTAVTSCHFCMIMLSKRNGALIMRF